MKKALLIGLIIFAAQAMAETKTFYISGDDTTDYNDMAGTSVTKFGWEFSGYADRRRADAYIPIHNNPSIRVFAQLGVDLQWTPLTDSYGAFFVSFRLANFSAANLPITSMRLILPYQLATATRGDYVEIYQSRFSRSSPQPLYMPDMQWFDGYEDPSRYPWFFWPVFDANPMSAYIWGNDMYSALDAVGMLRPYYDRLSIASNPPADTALWNDWSIDLLAKFPNVPRTTGQHDLTFFVRPGNNGTDIVFSNKQSDGSGDYNGDRMRIEVGYEGNPQPSPTPSATPTTGTTPTWTATPLPPTATFTNTASFTPTRSYTPTRTSTNTDTATPTSTGTATWNPLVNTPTPTRTFTGIPPSPTRTNTLSPTRTATRTNTVTHTFTTTQTFTPTVTNTTAPTATQTETVTLTFTPRFSPTISNTPAPTSTNTPRPTGTATNTGVPTGTVTPTWTVTRTFTATPTEDADATPTTTIANILTTGANGYPAAGDTGYIPRLVVGTIEYDTLQQRGAEQAAVSARSVYVPGGNSLTSEGLAVGGTSVIGQDGNVNFGDAFSVDAGNGRVEMGGDVAVRDRLNVESSDWYESAWDALSLNATSTLEIWASGRYETKRAGLDWAGWDVFTLDHFDALPYYPSISFGIPLVSSSLYATYDYGQYTGWEYDSGSGEWWLRKNFGAGGVGYAAFSPNGYINLDTSSHAGLGAPTTSAIKFANSDQLRYTNSTAVLDVYNGSASVFSVDADNGNTVMANNSTLTAETIYPVDSSGINLNLNSTGRVNITGAAPAEASPFGLRLSPTLTASTNGFAYAMGIYGAGTVASYFEQLFISDGSVTTANSRGVDISITKGSTSNYGIYGLAGGAGSSSNYGLLFYANGGTTGANYGAYISAANGAAGAAQRAVYAEAVAGTGAPTSNIGVEGKATGGSSYNYDFLASGGGNIVLSDSSQQIKADTAANTIQFGTVASAAAAGTVDTDNGNWTMVNGSVLTTETISPVDTTGIQINGTTNKVTVANDGNMTMAGTATYWDDVLVSGLSVETAGSADPALTAFPTGSPTKLYAFSASADNEVFATIQLPHKYKEGTNIGLHVHWSPATASTDDVVWGCDYSWANVLATPAAFPASTNTTVTADGGNLQWGHQIAGFPDLTGTGKTISSCLTLRIYRDADNAADTYTGLAFLISVDAHVECDSLGSNTTTGK